MPSPFLLPLLAICLFSIYFIWMFSWASCDAIDIFLLRSVAPAQTESHSSQACLTYLNTLKSRSIVFAHSIYVITNLGNWAGNTKLHVSSLEHTRELALQMLIYGNERLFSHLFFAAKTRCDFVFNATIILDRNILKLKSYISGLVKSMSTGILFCLCSL